MADDRDLFRKSDLSRIDAKDPYVVFFTV